MYSLCCCTVPSSVHILGAHLALLVSACAPAPNMRLPANVSDSTSLIATEHPSLLVPNRRPQSKLLHSAGKA
jgi:hypothetical protein